MGTFFTIFWHVVQVGHGKFLFENQHCTPTKFVFVLVFDISQCIVANGSKFLFTV